MLKAENITSGYGRVMIVNDVSFEINEGELVSIIGRNGIGKSTLMKTIIGLLKAEQGKITYLDNEITKSKSYERVWKGIGYVPQGHMVFPQLTVEENLKMGENINPLKGKKPNYDLVYEYFPRLAERRKQQAGTMSGGEQAMLSIGRVLIGNPKVMLLDEPSEGVQPNIVSMMGDIILRINKEMGLTVLLVEQHIGLIQQISQRCYAMEKGRIVQDMNREEVLDYEKIKRYLSV